MWQRLLPAYKKQNSGGAGGDEGGRPPRSPSLLKVQKEPQQQQQQHQKQRMMLKLGRRPWRGKTNQSKPLHRHRNSNTSNSNSKKVHNDNKKRKETDTIARLLSLERHLETDSDELFCWTEYDEDDNAVQHDRESPMAVTADDIEQALARFDTAIQQFTEEQEEDVTAGICMDTMTPPVPSIVSPNASFHGDNHRECSIAMIGPNILAGHNPISALSMYTEGDMTEMDNTDATINTIHTINTINTINTMPSLLDNNTVMTSNTMPSLVDHSISTSTCTYNSMPSLLDHTVTTNNTMPSLLDHTVTTVNTLPSMLDHSVTTLGYDDEDDDGGGEQVDEIDITGMNSNINMDMDIDIDIDIDMDMDMHLDVGMALNINMEMDMTVSTSGDGDEDTIAKAVNAVLKDHHSRDFLLPMTRRRESSLLVARRDSCSTISTAPDTPESPLVISEFLVGADSPHGKFKTTTTTKNPIPLETCQCPSPHCPRCTKTVWPLEFFFVHTAPLFPSKLPRIRKSKKFVPDPMNVGDFYGDDDEDIRFVPQAYEQDTPSSRTTSTTTTTKEQGDEEIVFGLSPTRVAKNMDKTTDDKDYHHDDDDATSTISTWTDDQENDDDDDDEECEEEEAEEDEMDSQVKSYSHRSGSTDIVSQMTADRTPKFKNKCNSNTRLQQRDHNMDDEWKENLSGLLRNSDHESRPNNHLFARYHDKTLHGAQHALASGNLRGTAMTAPGWALKPDRTTTGSTTTESLLAKMVRPPYAPTPTPPPPTTATAAAVVPRPNRLWRCPSMGLDGILPPLRHNLSFLIPPPPPSPPPPLPIRTSHPMSGNFQVTRIEI